MVAAGEAGLSFGAPADHSMTAPQNFAAYNDVPPSPVGCQLEPNNCEPDTIINGSHDPPLSGANDASRPAVQHVMRKETLGKKRKRPRPLQPRWKVVTAYVSLATAAVILTALCQDTELWGVNHNSTTNNTTSADEIDSTYSTTLHIFNAYNPDNLNHPLLLKLLASLVLVLATLASVQGSDPGYVTADTVRQAFDNVEEDEAGLIDNADGIVRSSQEDNNEGSGDVELGEVGNGTVRRSASLTAIPQCRAGNGAEATLPAKSSPPRTVIHRKPQPWSQPHRPPCEHCPTQTRPPYRPLRTQHCRHCNKCVATFDHHCFFIGTCIGERNHCRFWWFLTAQIIGFGTCVNVVGGSRVGIKMGLNYMLGFAAGSSSSSSSLNAANVAIVVLAKIYLYPLTFFAMLMWLSHTFFALANVTTYECGKGSKKIDYLRGTKEMDLPFSRGCIANIRNFCCYRDASSWLCPSILRYAGNSSIELEKKQGPKQANGGGDCAGTGSWTPILWRPPGKIDRDSENWWENPWENKYWSCC